MKDFIRLFVRVGPGIWVCVRNGEFYADDWRMQVAIGTTFTKGTHFMGMDLAAALDAEYEKKNGNARPEMPQSSIEASPPE